MVGFSYVHSTSTSFKASVSKGFRSPTVMEMFLYAPNPDLKPERVINYELSWLQSLLNNKIQVELTAFLVNGENLIQIVPPLVSMRQNIGTFSNKGIEFSGKYYVSKGFILQGNYSLVDADKITLAAPRHQANLSLNWAYKTLNFNISAQQVSLLYTRIKPTPISESYTLVNARVSVQALSWLNVFVMGNNLLNQRYETNYGYPMPNTYFNTGFKVSI